MQREKVWVGLDLGGRGERGGGGRQLNAKVVITEINKAVSNTSSEAFND